MNDRKKRWLTSSVEMRIRFFFHSSLASSLADEWANERTYEQIDRQTDRHAHTHRQQNRVFATALTLNNFFLFHFHSKWKGKNQFSWFFSHEIFHFDHFGISRFFFGKFENRFLLTQVKHTKCELLCFWMLKKSLALNLITRKLLMMAVKGVVYNSLTHWYTQCSFQLY